MQIYLGINIYLFIKKGAYSQVFLYKATDGQVFVRRSMDQRLAEKAGAQENTLVF